MKRPHYLFVILLLVLSPTAAANEPSPLRFRNLTLADGLSHSRVVAIHQDQQGYLWFGTQKGLNRYDGHRFRHFLQDVDDPQALADDYVISMDSDEEGALWLGTKTGGPHRFDLQTETFKRFGSSADHAEGALPVVRCLFLSPQLVLLMRGRGELLELNPSNGSIDPVESFSGIEVTNVYELAPDRVWVSSTDGLFELNLVTREAKKPEVAISDSVLARSDIRTIYQDRSQTLWIGTTEGLLRLSPDGEWRTYLSSISPEKLYEDRAGRFWVGTFGEGLAQYVPEIDDFIFHQQDPFEPDSLIDNIVFDIFEDRDGLLWIGTRAGLSILEPSRQALATYQRDPMKPAVGAFNNILALEEDDSGNLWLGTLGEGLLRLEPDRRGPRRWRQEVGRQRGLAHDFVWALHVDLGGNLWIGTEVGLGRIDAENLDVEEPAFSSYQHDPANPQGLREGRVFTILEDRRGDLWIGTQNGLSRLDSETGTIWAFVQASERYESLTRAPILALHEDPSGVLWIGYDGAGLGRLDPKTGQFDHFVPTPGDPRTLGGGIVTAIRQGPEGTMWIASYGGGLERFFPQSGEFVDILSAELPANPSVSNLLEDQAGALWLTVGSDVYRYWPDSTHPKHSGLTTLNPADHRISGFFIKAAMTMPDGELLLGSNHGLVSIRPDRLFSYKDPPMVSIADFQVLGREVAIDEWRSGRVVLTHRDLLFRIDFAALHYADPNKNLYRYRLKGLSDGWIEGDASNPSAQFSRLDPGTYTFHVQAAHKDRVWNEEGAGLEIVVLAAPWRTAWAYTLYLLILTAFVLSYVRSQRRKLARERQLAEQERAVSRKLREVAQLKDELLAEKEVEVQVLTGLLPICSSCKKIRDDEGDWQQMESYIDNHSEASFSHGICPSCIETLYPEVDISDM